MSDDARIEDGLDVLEALLAADMGTIMLTRNEEPEDENERFEVSVLVGTKSRAFKGASLSDAVEKWRTFKLRRYQEAVEVLRR